MTDFLIYLVEVSVCQTVFFGLYYVVFRKHTFFQANRAYLLGTTLLSFIIPLVNIGVWSTLSINNPILFPLSLVSESPVSAMGSSPVSTSLSRHIDLPTIIFIAYIAGFVIRLIKLLTGIRRVMLLTHKQNVFTLNGHRVIKVNSGPSFFSFWKHIYINENKLDLSEQELQNVLEHERVHINEKHTLDILTMELAAAICWFNPITNKIKHALSQTHEFIADKVATTENNDIDTYSRLILRLSKDRGHIPLTHQFSMIKLKNRITMLHQSKQNQMNIFKLFFAVPTILALLAIFSFNEKQAGPDLSTQTNKGDLVIGEIHWEGNKKFSDAMLSKVLGLNKGDIFNKENVQKSLSYNPSRDDLGSLYMDNGYLYFSCEMKDTIVGKNVNLTFRIYEGITVPIDKIRIKGNEKVSTSTVLNMLEFKSGELFDRSKLIQSQRNISESGYFVSDSILINPIPHHEGTLVDIEFVVTEL